MTPFLVVQRLSCHLWSGHLCLSLELFWQVVTAGGGRGEAWGGVREGEVTGQGREAARKQFIEERNERGLVDRAAVLSSFFADLSLLATADMLVRHVHARA